MDKLIMSDVFHTGKRLNIARTLRKLRLKDIAAEFNVQEDTILKWQSRGVPKKFLPALAHYFSVDEWVFLNEGIFEKEFQEIILDPKKLGSISPVFSFKSKLQEGTNPLEKSYFDIRNTKILIRASVWGVEGRTYSPFMLIMKGYYQGKPLHRGLYPSPKTLRLITEETTSVEDEVMSEMIVERVRPGTYYFSVYTPNHYKLFVYELSKYPFI